MATRLFHIAEPAEWAAVGDGDTYAPAAFAREGFVHCSYPEQVAATAARHYAGRTDLLLLEIDPSRLGAPVIEEPSPTTAEPFPHVYGPIARDAVIAVHPFSAVFPELPEGR
jgi:uncharacterized protein (DUF952 family)